MRITKGQLRRVIQEVMELDLEVGDVILTGKFKNKRKVVKDFGKDDLGQPTINGIKALTFRIEKMMPKDKWSKESKESLEFAKKVNEVKLTKRQLRKILKEALTKTDIGEIERISRKQAKSEIEKVVGKNFSKAVKNEVIKQLKDRATKQEIADISKIVIKKIYRSLAIDKSFIIDQVKV